MAEGPSLLLRMTLLLLLLGVTSLQLQAWMSRRDVKEKKARSARSVRHESVVVGEAAGRGVPGRVQCRDARLFKNGSSGNEERHGPCLNSEKEIVSFVTLFVVPKAETEVEVEKRMTLKKMERNTLYAVLRIFLESVKVSMPGTTQVTVITNQDRVEKEFPQSVVWKPSTREFSRENLMVQRLELYIDILEDMIEKRRNSSAKPRTHVIFSDFDMIVVDDLGCVFKDYLSFDVALTFRNNRRQPINSGVIMVRGTLESLSRGKQLLKEVVEVYRAKFSQAFGVLGDQLALADLVKGAIQAASIASQGVLFEARVMAAKILFLPCSTYNWTPSEGAGQFHGMPTDVKILHFKGSRKRLMIQAWNLYNQQNVEDFSNMKCLVLKSGRAKYDY